jgi:hypothetical protein
MKTKNRTIVFIGTVVLVIGSGITEGMAIETMSPVSKPIRLSPILVWLQGGPGPVCYPGIGCGRTGAVYAWKDGPGPVCFPGIGCGRTDAVRVRKDGPGPVCFPGIGCGKAQSLGVGRVLEDAKYLEA